MVQLRIRRLMADQFLHGRNGFHTLTVAARRGDAARFRIVPFHSNTALLFKMPFLPERDMRPAGTYSQPGSGKVTNMDSTISTASRTSFVQTD